MSTVTAMGRLCSMSSDVYLELKSIFIDSNSRRPDRGLFHPAINSLGLKAVRDRGATSGDSIRPLSNCRRFDFRSRFKR
jgi:hypothetical protein